MFDPGNILVIDFGQLGDVVLSVPALRAIREKFRHARITVAVGKPGADVVALSGYANSMIVVDRVGLRDGPKLISIAKILKLVKDVRRQQFDFVIDLHSLSETNLLGFFSGAAHRLYSRRPGRSLNFLSNFRPNPPIEDNSKHFAERYLDVLRPLDIKDVSSIPILRTRSADDVAVEKMLRKEKGNPEAPLVGLFPGAGHPGRRWPLERFATLADHLIRNERVRVIVFAGPEEKQLIQEIRKQFPPAAILFDRLTIPQLASAQAKLSVFVSNDTGPLHLAAAVGTSVVMLMDRPTPNSFVPQEQHHRTVYGKKVEEVEVSEVYKVTCELLAGRRTAALFTR
ncbi:MAG TPA: glycosyltransferase family 9 protein [Pyrinomonadaceae bacterium]|nr:glycosyltransferase family 9 protein [Pyrinomonadaceae bacterium]